MLRQIFLTSCLVMMTSCWRIDVSEKHVAMQLSLDVTLDCRNHDDNNSPKLDKVTKLRILKRKPNNQWVSLAKVERNRTRSHVETLLPNVMLTGNAWNLSNSFIKLEFPLATEDAIGQFVCEVEGHYSGEELKHVSKSKPVVINQRDATYQDMLKVIVQFKKQNETKNVNDHILFVLLQKMINLDIKDKSTSKLLTDRMNEFDKDLEKINDSTDKLTNDVKSVVQAIPTPDWPAGTYALLKSKSGCPYSSTFNWQKNYFQINTRPGSYNDDGSSPSSHLSSDTFRYDSSKGRTYPFIRICSKIVAVDGPIWPKGSYCIVYHNGNCPEGLTRGYIRLGTFPGTFHYNFCCRKDGYASNPIQLPSTEPFYLFRIGGTCQKVKGMDVSPEWMKMDTNRDADLYSSVYTPDGNLSPVKLELCYYKPSVYNSN